METAGIDVIYVHDLTPTIIDLTFTDAKSTANGQITLASTVDGNAAVIVENGTDNEITTFTNNDPVNVAFQNVLTEGNYFGNVIFAVTDTSNNTGEFELAHFTVDETSPEITRTRSSIVLSDDAPYPNFIDVTFEDEMLFNSTYGSEEDREAIEVTDFTVTLTPGIGQARLLSNTPSSITSSSPVLNAAIAPGDSVIRLQLNLHPDYPPDGTEVVTVNVAGSSYFYDAAGNGVSTTQSSASPIGIS